MAYEGGKQAREFLDIAVVQEHLKLAAETVARSASEAFMDAIRASLKYSAGLRLDSPLEAMFWIWWSACEMANTFVAEHIELRPQVECVVARERVRIDYIVAPIDSRLNEAIETGRVSWTPIAVELDGHEFHERTREQVEKRDRRDRLLQKAGWKVFHFSWGEFTKDPENSAAEVFIFARDQYTRASTALYRLDHPEL